MEVVHKVKDREKGCPVGHRCDDCNLYVPLYVPKPDGSVVAEYDCSWNNAVKLADAVKNRVVGVQQATESFRNEVVEVKRISGPSLKALK